MIPLRLVFVALSLLAASGQDISFDDLYFLKF